MTHSWRDLEELAIEEPGLRRFFDLAQRDHWTSKQMLKEALWWYVKALQSCRAQLLEAKSTQRNGYYLNDPLPSHGGTRLERD